MKVSAKQYGQALYDLTEGKNENEIDVIITDFVAKMKSNGHLKFSRDVIMQFEKKYNDVHNIITAHVTSAFPLQNEQKDVLEKYIVDEYSAKSIITEYHEDRSIKGGVVVRVGDEVLDASVDGKLRLINDALLN